MIIKHHAHPFAGGMPRVCEAHNIGEWLLETFGKVPSVSVQIFVGEPSDETNITRDIKKLIASDAPVYTVLESPGGDAGKFLGAALLLPMAFGFLAANAAFPTAPTFDGGLNNTASKSSNNSLSDRSNKVRILQRVEDIYGTVRAIPSLIAPTYTKYISHIQYEYAYLCVGRGYYTITDLRDGETPFADIDGARAAIFDPFTSPNSGDAPVLSVGGAIEDDVLTVKRSNDVDGITLKASNQIQLTNTQPYDFVPAAIAGTSGDLIRQNEASPTFAAVVSPGNTITVTMTPVPKGTPLASTNISATAATKTFALSSGTFAGLSLTAGDNITVSGGLNAGSYTVGSFTTTTIIVLQALIDEAAGTLITITNNASTDYSGNYEIDSVDAAEVVLTTSTFTENLNDATATILIDDATEWTAWATLSETDRTQVWANIIAINGMYKDGGEGKISTTVNYELEIEQLDASLVPTGIVETVTDSLSGATNDVRATTLESVTGFAGPCRVRARRTTEFDYSFGGAVVDEIKIADLYSVSPVTKTHFGNLTTIQTVSKATLRALAAKERQLNCLASRLLPTYDGSVFSGAFDSTGLLTSGTISATSRFVDIVAAVSVDPVIGARTLSTDVDIAQIYTTCLAVEAWGTEYAEFNYTFDSDNLSYEETVKQISNAVFCIAYRQNGKIRFAFDTAQASSVVPTFCHRNKKPKSESVTRNFAADADYDGIELVYMDPDTERNETIKLPLSGLATKYKKVEVPGIRNYNQAWMRANREYERLKNQRSVIETTATTDARALLPNSRVDIVDDTRFKRFGGEIVAQDGLTLTLSQEVEFTSGEAHSILLKKRNGDSEGITVTQGAHSKQVILQSLPSEDIVTTGGADGIRTIYSFASDTQRAAQAWLVQEIIPQDRQYVQIRAVNYSDAYYQHDNESIPDKSTVIYS